MTTPAQRAIAPIHEQRRLLEVGRIRLGDKADAGNPRKLAAFRMTSADKMRLELAAGQYGGAVRPWDGNKWELYTEQSDIAIAVVPGQALSVSYELWGKAEQRKKESPVICLRRCDGVTEALSGDRCLCAGEPEQQCKPTTRVSVILRDVPGVGVWRVESHGWNALFEMQGQVELLEMLVASGRPIKARLRLEQRKKATAGGTRSFVVPTIDIDHTVDQVLQALGSDGLGVAELEPLTPTPPPALEAAPPAIATTSAPARNPDLKPPAPGPAAPSVAEQLGRPAEQPETKPRARAAEPIKSTGVTPRTVDQVDRPGEVELVDEEPPPETEAGPTMPLQQRVAMWIGELEAGDEYRHRFLEAFSDGAYTSAKDVPSDGATITALRATILRMKRGAVRLADMGDGSWRFREAATGLPTNDPGGQSPARRGGPVDPDSAGPERQAEQPDGTTPPTNEADWRKLLAGVDGIGPARLLKYARETAAEAGLEQPSGLDEIDAELGARCVAWLAER